MEPFLYDKFFEVEDRHWWFAARSDIIVHIILNRLGIPEGSKILDIGCGTGGPLVRLAERFDAWGIDNSELAIEYCKRRKLEHVVCGNLDDFVRTHQDFRLAALLDVVEHVDDDISFLRYASESLSEEGILLITVPAYPFLWSKHDEANHHKRRYTRKTLTKSICDAGLSIQFMSYYNTLLFPAAVAQRFIEKLLRRDSDSELDMPGPVVNSLLRKIFASERVVLKSLSFPFGVSLVAAAKRGN